MRDAAGDRRAWWERRRAVFTAAVAAGYAIASVLWELTTPSWAGDHIGFDGGALVFRALGMLVWLFWANLAYFLPQLLERVVRPADACRYRRRAFRAAITLGAGSLPAWLGFALVEQWLRRR